MGTDRANARHTVSAGGHKPPSRLSPGDDSKGMNAPIDNKRRRTAAFRWLESRLGTSLAAASRALSDERRLELATAVALAGGVVLIVAEFLDLFHIRAVSGISSDEEQTGGDHHFYALLVVGVVAIGATLLARALQVWPPAAAVAALGLVALFIVLAVDLPDASSSGLTENLERAEASLARGFWVELAGALAVFTGGTATTTLLRRGSG